MLKLVSPQEEQWGTQAGVLGRSRAAGALPEISCEAGEVMDGARMGEESWAGCLPTRQEHSRAGWPEQDPGFPPFFRGETKASQPCLWLCHWCQCAVPGTSLSQPPTCCSGQFPAVSGQEA